MEKNKEFQVGNTVYAASSEEVAVIKGMIIEIDDSCCPPHVGYIDSDTKTRKCQ